MRKILLVSSFIFAIFIACSFISVQAADENMHNVGESIRNVAEGTKNTVQNVATDAGNAISRGGETVKNTTENFVAGTTNTNTNYDATRTATTRSAAGTDVTFLGMNATGWTWFVVGILGVLIVAFVWYYAKQPSKNTRNTDE